MKFEREIGFVSASETVKGSKERRRQDVSKSIPFGIKYLDNLLRGILPSDLILIGAKTGSGKTELVSHIASQCALAGKRVYMFALEAERGEIEDRLEYKISTALYRESKDYDLKLPLNYQDWWHGDFEKQLGRYDSIARDHIAKLDNLVIYYRRSDFGIRELTKAVASIKDNADIIFLDHIHFVDLQTKDQLKELGDITKKIRDLVQLYKIPVFLVAHLRKLERDQSIIPSIEDFHGSSDLTKMITKGIMLAPGGMYSETEANTFFRIVKNRKFGSVQELVGRGIYNLETNEYGNRFQFGKLIKGDKEFKPMSLEELPKWLRAKI